MKFFFLVFVVVKIHIIRLTNRRSFKKIFMTIAVATYIAKFCTKQAFFLVNKHLHICFIDKLYEKSILYLVLSVNSYCALMQPYWRILCIGSNLLSSVFTQFSTALFFIYSSLVFCTLKYCVK